MNLILDRTYDPVVKSWFNAVGKPSKINAINTCVKRLREAGILKELDLFHLIGGLDSDLQRLRPLITTSTTKTFTAVASPTLAFNGVTGNGTTSYLNLGWEALANKVKFTQNSCSFGTYSRTQSAAGVSSDIGENGALISPRRAGDSFVHRLNDLAAESISNTVTLGLISLTRTSASLKTAYKNGVALGTGVQASVSPRANNFFLCGHNVGGALTNPSVRNYAMCFIGSADFDQAKFYRIIQDYMTEVGLAV